MVTSDAGWDRVRLGTAGPHRWGGAAGLREERGRVRRRLKAALLVGVVFGYGLVQVWISTEAAERASRVDQLGSEIKRLEVDLTVNGARLASRRIYGELVAPAESRGFGPAAEYRGIVLRQKADQTGPGIWGDMAEELHRGSQLILPEALAQDLWAEGRGRGRRP